MGLIFTNSLGMPAQSDPQHGTAVDLRASGSHLQSLGPYILENSHWHDDIWHVCRWSLYVYNYIILYIYTHILGGVCIAVWNQEINWPRCKTMLSCAPFVQISPELETRWDPQIPVLDCALNCHFSTDWNAIGSNMFDTQVACRHVGRNMSGTPWQRSMQNRQPFWAKRINTIGDKEIPYVIYVYMCIDILYIQQDGSNRYQPLASILQCINLMMTRSSPRPAGLAWQIVSEKTVGFPRVWWWMWLDRTFRPPKFIPLWEQRINMSALCFFVSGAAFSSLSKPVWH